MLQVEAYLHSQSGLEKLVLKSGQGSLELELLELELLEEECLHSMLEGEKAQNLFGVLAGSDPIEVRLRRQQEVFLHHDADRLVFRECLQHATVLVVYD